MTELQSLPSPHHPQADEFIDKFSGSFNKLAEKLEANGIDVDELWDVVASAQDLERLKMVSVIGEGFYKSLCLQKIDGG